MKFLSRMIAVVALLGVLAYGSYAFGMYVLSAKLFGDGANSKALRNVSRSTTEASAITRQTGWKGTKPRVEVKVLPANESGAGAPLPAYADEDGFQKSAPREERRDSDSDSENAAPPARLGKREFDSGGVDYSLGDENKTRKRSSRRHRKSRSKPEETKPAPKPDETQATPAPPPAAEESSGDDNGKSSRDNSKSQSNGDSGSDRAIISNKPSSERESAPRETPKPREKSRRRNNSTRTKTRDASPVPRPEGSRSGGDSATSSPVPQPE
jgi:hypothetical protein